MYKFTKHCRLCLHPTMKVGVKLAKMPLGEKYTRSKKSALKGNKFPLSIGWCSKCKNIQTMEVVKPKLLWGDFTYLSGQTKFIIEHFQQFSKKIIKRFRLNKDDFVVDIGSNDGSLLNFFKKKKMKVLGIDPADTVAILAQKKGVDTIIDYFSLKLSKKINKKYKKAKIITCFNTFAHSEHLRDMMKGVTEILDDKGVFIFECQYLTDIYRNKILGTFFHEHMYHHSVTTLNNFFKMFDLTLFDVEKVNIQKGSIIGYVGKKNQFRVSKNVKDIMTKERLSGDTKFTKLVKFQNYIDEQKKTSIKILNKYKEKTIAGYGAARSGPTLAINFGINKYLKMIFDDHKLKRNKYTPLDGLFVYPTKMLLKIKPDVCVVLAYLHLKKIIKKNVNYLKSGGKFLSIYPKPLIIDYKNYKKFV